MRKINEAVVFLCSDNKLKLVKGKIVSIQYKTIVDEDNERISDVTYSIRNEKTWYMSIEEKKIFNSKEDFIANFIED